MKLFKKNESKETVKLPMSGKVKKASAFTVWQLWQRLW